LPKRPLTTFSIIPTHNPRAIKLILLNILYSIRDNAIKIIIDKRNVELFKDRLLAIPVKRKELANSYVINT
jgi:hypothetical protein